MGLGGCRGLHARVQESRASGPESLGRRDFVSRNLGCVVLGNVGSGSRSCSCGV